MTRQEFFDFILSWARDAAIRIIVSIVVIFVSFKIINALARRIEKTFQAHHSDKTIMRTVSYIFKVGLKTVILVCLVSYLGIDTTGLTALIASLGVGIGLAVNGALSNLAGGVLLIITRPFRIDDYIEAQGYSGTVVDIHITNTKLKTPDNKIIFLPNGQVSSGAIVNYSMQNTRRVDEEISVPRDADYEHVKEILTELYKNNPMVLKEPEVFIRISERAASSLKITVRAWVKSEDYWTVKFDMIEAVKAKLDEEGIIIPFEQMDVRIKKDAG